MTFRLDDEDIALPAGAFAHSQRRILRRNGRPVLALTQGKHRPYLYPLFTPKGFAVTSESPADHPHHNSLWVAADHVHIRMPTAAGFEDYAYNFYVDDVFQGRAPGRLVETGCEVAEAGPDAIRIVQAIEWRAPAEWAAPLGRVVLAEQRELRVGTSRNAYVLDITSRLTARDWDVVIGPTRHSYFNARVAESIAYGGIVTDDRGDAASRLPGVDGARWVDASGHVGGGHVAGIAVLPHPEDHPELAWFVTAWGVMTATAHRLAGQSIPRGATAVKRCRFVVHDGVATEGDIAGAYAAYARGEESPI